VPIIISESITLKIELGLLNDLSGFIAVALIDADSGLVVKQLAKQQFDLELASALNTEVVKAKRRAVDVLNLRDDIEDILITLGKQYHLIRPLENLPQYFLYLAVDRASGNLGLARTFLRKVEQTIDM
jgi:predicted regulator of Ras-like GTPase activity (Roadblock/LC7/MglB family)